MWKPRHTAMTFAAGVNYRLNYSADVALKKVRPGFGGSLAARGPVWDGEGWGCDRLA
jgi:hypothetical protein